MKKSYSTFKGIAQHCEDFGSNASVRCSSAFETEDQKKAIELLQSKSKWISKNEFKRFFGKIKPSNSPQNYLNQIPYKCPSNHKFRENSKDKWIDAKNFSVI